MQLTHLDSTGNAHMVDVSLKNPTPREAVAKGFLRCSEMIMQALRDGEVPKGDALAVARIAGISAAKMTAQLLPLAHPISVNYCTLELKLSTGGVEITATVRTVERTGIEMEALTAVSVAALNLVDMVKGVDRQVSIENLRIVSKSGGRSGTWIRPGETS